MYLLLCIVVDRYIQFNCLPLALNLDRLWARIAQAIEPCCRPKTSLSLYTYFTPILIETPKHGQQNHFYLQMGRSDYIQQRQLFWIQRLLYTSTYCCRSLANCHWRWNWTSTGQPSFRCPSQTTSILYYSSRTGYRNPVWVCQPSIQKEDHGIRAQQYYRQYIK
jgi:hypothetical protein